MGQPYGHIELVECGYTKNRNFEGCSIKALTSAIINGYMPLVEFISYKLFEQLFNTYNGLCCYEWSSTYTHLVTYTWIKLGMHYVDAMDLAAKNGHSTCS